MKWEGTISFTVETDPTKTQEDVETMIINAWLKGIEKGEINFEECDSDYYYDDMNELVITKVKEALNKYDSENIDVIINEETNCLYIMYHSYNNSFPVSEDIVHEDHVLLGELEEKLDELGVGHVWQKGSSNMVAINAITRESMDMIVEEIMNVMDADWLSEESKPFEIERILIDNGLAAVIEEGNE